MRAAYGDSSSPIARLRLIDSLAQRRRCEPTTIDFLRWLSSAADLGTRAAAIDALSRLDPDAAPVIAAMAGEPLLLSNVARALERLQDERSFAVLAQIATASEASGSARYLAARALGRCGSPAAVPYLRQIERTDDANVSQLAASALAARR
ncbi:MAG: HEAT repeat domain-containing protein [Planctomycetota bacterium]